MPRPLPLGVKELERLVERFGTPLQVYDEAGIRANVRHLLDTGAKTFGRFRNYFAVKALPNPAILRILLSEGCGLDCSSAAELELAARLGVSGDRVMFTSNYTSREDLHKAWKQGVVINLDDASLVATLREVSGAGAFPELISFRLNPGVGRTDSETGSNVLGGPQAKFGVPPEEIVEAYRTAQAAGARRFGMHMMTGSCVMSDEYWLESVGALVAAMGRVERALGVRFEFVNLGGGLGIPYRPGEAEVDLEVLFGKVRRALQAGCETHGVSGRDEMLVSMENGRFVTGPFGWLVARVQAEKRAFGQRYLGLDASMANLMRPAMYGAFHAITVPAREDVAAPRERVHVVGTLCENNDWFARDRPLPADTQVGDLVVLHDTGAHGHAMGFQYNGKLRAPEVLLRAHSRASDGASSADLIRRRETYDDLFSTALLPPDLDTDNLADSILQGNKPTKHATDAENVVFQSALFAFAVASIALAASFLRGPSRPQTQ